ncbi:MAG: glutamate synthase large subunit [Baekduia sp.]
MTIRALPQADGLYDPTNEHDACGVAMVARLDNRPEHEVVVRALTALDNLEHRGAEGADIHTGDGAGILTQVPDAFFRAVCDFELPAAGDYGVGMCFLPQDPDARRKLEELIELNVRIEGQELLGWRDVPVDEDHVGSTANRTRPYMKQVFVGAGSEHGGDNDAFERKLYVIRRIIELAAGPDFYSPSFSSRTIVYKGMLISPQLGRFYPDLKDERYASALALVHSRFSTNTFPSWDLAHPFRVIAHNGEINTMRGNANWMQARESQLASELFGLDLQKILPIIRPGGSDSATFDNVLELLMLAGRSLPHAAMMMIPEAYAGRDDLSDELKGFYAFHSCLMEPWDGPASVCFTNGRVVGATLDRNGLRPGRWVQTTDGYVALGSETGMLPIEPEEVVALGRLAPGKLFLVDLEQGRIVEDGEVKAEVAGQQPYGRWFEENVLRFEDLPECEPKTLAHPLRDLQRAFGYSQEDLRVLLAPMAERGEEPIGSMGNDAALAVLSERQPPLFSYFKQLFAQVTNPPIDPIRESIVMSVGAGVGAERNLLEESPEHARQLVMRQPILRNSELETLRSVDHPHFRSHTLDITWARQDGIAGLRARLANLCDEAFDGIQAGANILILSDRSVGPRRVPIPSLLAVAAVHHHLVRAGTRLRAGLVLESGEPREVHHFATLIGYGASAINPYVMFESVDKLVADGRVGEAPQDAGALVAAQDAAQANVVQAIGKGLLKTISKMGISTIQSYCGAQIFEAVGLDRSVIDRHFTGTASRIGGATLDALAGQAIDRHERGFRYEQVGDRGELLPVGGLYAWRRDGEHHMWNPETISVLQHAVRDENPGSAQEQYDRYAELANNDATRRATLRGLLTFATDGVTPIDLDEVEPAKEIVKRFATGAMSLGSISTEAHENLAIAMNRLGGRSNTGEGGEDPRRFTRDENGDLRRSAIKQVASGRFGVTAHYLVNADQLQIKMAQGAKPGEGGQLPGHKVDDYIGSVRHTTPGVGLISPPPHHDIYSIEDLKQLIYDLRCANPKAQVSVKLVAEVGVGTVAAGVAKANADHVVIAGHDGGTGASPLSSIVSAGVPWEIGLAETQQTLLKNDLRTRIVVQTDGQLKTGRDVVIAALLGADEMGFSTAPLIATGCIMMRACHLNTCPVGIATQDPELRKRFKGTPENVVNFFFFVAEEARKIMAQLGVRSFDELIGRVDLLRADTAVAHYRERGIDLGHLLAFPEDVDPEGPRRRLQGPPAVLDDALDHELIAQARPAIEGGQTGVRIETPVRNTNRCVGGMLSSRIAELHGAGGLPDGAIDVHLRGSAGQSFGGWLMPGVTFTLHGDANDYTCKGLSGGTVAVMPPEGVTFTPEDNVIIGNTCLYGATSGKAFFRGQAGERFAVRNSGAQAVIEGVGDHGCEYMTGGVVVVLGPTGRNFAAGMSGGLAFVHDPEGRFRSRVNPTMLDQLEELDDSDAALLHDLVAEHVARTGSTVGQTVIDGWSNTRSEFVKVFPADYKRVLAERAAVTPEEVPA